MNAGSCWPSSSIVTIQSPPEEAIPARVAACCPKFRLSQTVRTNGYCSASPRITAAEAVRAVVVHQQDLGDPQPVSAGVW